MFLQLKFASNTVNPSRNEGTWRCLWRIGKEGQKTMITRNRMLEARKLIGLWNTELQRSTFQQVKQRKVFGLIQSQLWSNWLLSTTKRKRWTFWCTRDLLSGTLRARSTNLTLFHKILTLLWIIWMLKINQPSSMPLQTAARRLWKHWLHCLKNCKSVRALFFVL